MKLVIVFVGRFFSKFLLGVMIMPPTSKVKGVGCETHDLAVIGDLECTKAKHLFTNVTTKGVSLNCAANANVGF